MTDHSHGGGDARSCPSRSPRTCRASSANSLVRRAGTCGLLGAYAPRTLPKSPHPAGSTAAVSSCLRGMVREPESQLPEDLPLSSGPALLRTSPMLPSLSTRARISASVMRWFVVERRITRNMVRGPRRTASADAHKRSQRPECPGFHRPPVHATRSMREALTPVTQCHREQWAAAFDHGQRLPR